MGGWSLFHMVKGRAHSGQVYIRNTLREFLQHWQKHFIMYPGKSLIEMEKKILVRLLAALNESQ